MYKPTEWENLIHTSSPDQFINILMSNNIIKRSQFCSSCNIPMKLVEYTRNNDKVAWRCMNKICCNYKKYFSVRINSVFENFSIDIRILFNIIIKHAIGMQKYQIDNYYESKHNFIIKK